VQRRQCLSEADGSLSRKPDMLGTATQCPVLKEKRSSQYGCRIAAFDPFPILASQLEARF
jgi:hypothetical protein